MTKEFFERGKQIAKWADNNMTKDKALQMAINALTNCSRFEEAIQACKEALEQPAQEPVAWMNDIAFSMDKDELTTDKFGDIVPLYTAPPSREWQGLSDDEINLIYPCTGGEHDFKDIARAIEAKLREKNEK